jgi:hypothetical protein
VRDTGLATTRIQKTRCSVCPNTTLAEVRDAAGHANVSITSAYLHVAVEDQEVENLFLFG